jgi:hypothetical protein
MPGTRQYHTFDVILDEEKFMKHWNGTYVDLWRKMKDRGIDIEYKSAMKVFKNENPWKLIYAWMVAEILGVKIEDIFVKVSKE